MKLFTMMVALIGALAACAPVDAQPQPSEAITITLARSACFGFCPIYRVSIDGAGNVTYVGERFVNVRGEQRAQIPAADVQALLRRFDEIGFARLRDQYRANVTDLPTYTVSLTRNGVTKTVVDYGGTGAGMPESVRALQDEIDRVAGTSRWVLRNGEPVRDRPQP
ncbi:DUF6438 domain-containing protein [Terricaulis sp.]|uniref:DUF6438 domain-containing protein n=1 Tax=Terricaulis sp. TaxID=2768686 RepID=UPI003782D364